MPMTRLATEKTRATTASGKSHLTLTFTLPIVRKANDCNSWLGPSWFGGMGMSEFYRIEPFLASKSDDDEFDISPPAPKRVESQREFPMHTTKKLIAVGVLAFLLGVGITWWWRGDRYTVKESPYGLVRYDQHTGSTWMSQVSGYRGELKFADWKPIAEP